MAASVRRVHSTASSVDRRGIAWGVVGVAVLLALTFVGSDGLLWFDAALIGYLYGLVFAVFGILYRYTVWLRRPPTAMLNRPGGDACRAGGSRKADKPPAVVCRRRLPVPSC